MSRARRSDPRVAEALEEIEALAAKLIVLGSYEAWTEGSRLSAPVPTPAHRVEKPGVPLVDRQRHPEGSRRARCGTCASGARRRCSSRDPARSRVRR